MRKTLRTSGFRTASKAYAMNASKTLIDPGVEEAPAGEQFGLIRGVSGIRNEAPITYDDKVKIAGAWGSYIVNSTNSGLIFWEQYTLYGDEAALAYIRTVDVVNYIYHVHKDIMKAKQFRGESDEEIIEALSAVLNRFTAKNVLIPSPDDAEYPDPYSIWITQSGAKRQIHRAIRTSYAIGPIVLETIPL